MNRITNCIIIHGCPNYPEPAKVYGNGAYYRHWMPWLKTNLEKVGITTETPKMPTPWKPDYKKFKKKFEKYKVTENTILIGHSCGAAFLVRWLGETNQKVSKLILVAPWKVASKESIAKKVFYDFEIKPKIKSQANEIVIFTSNNEKPDGKRSLQIYKKALDCKIVNLQNKGHFTFPDMKSIDFPELLDLLTKKNK